MHASEKQHLLMHRPRSTLFAGHSSLSMGTTRDWRPPNKITSAADPEVCYSTSTTSVYAAYLSRTLALRRPDTLPDPCRHCPRLHCTSVTIVPSSSLHHHHHHHIHRIRLASSTTQLSHRREVEDYRPIFIRWTHPFRSACGGFGHFRSVVAVIRFRPITSVQSDQASLAITTYPRPMIQHCRGILA